MSKIEGSNIIGVFPGLHFGTNQDEFMIVVAHWDTVLHSPGFDDNGSGMSALLEIARALSTSSIRQDECKTRKNSVILAALDLEEVGTHGAMAFLHEFFVPKILQAYDFPNLKVHFLLTQWKKLPVVRTSNIN